MYFSTEQMLQYVQSSDSTSSLDPQRPRSIEPVSPDLCDSLRWRLMQILVIRDRIHSSQSAPPDSPDHRRAIELITDFDSILLYFQAMLDIMARVVHSIYVREGNIDIRRANWQNDKWTRIVYKHAPKLKLVAASNVANRHLMQVISELRNTIHAIPINLNHVIFVTGKHPMEVLLPLPTDLRDRFFEWIRSLGGFDVCGIVIPLDGYSWHMRLAVFLEHLLPKMIQLIDDLLSAMFSVPDEDNLTAQLLLFQVRAKRTSWALGIQEIDEYPFTRVS